MRELSGPQGAMRTVKAGQATLQPVWLGPHDDQSFSFSELYSKIPILFLSISLSLYFMPFQNKLPSRFTRYIL